jgi:soluble lytic murein transglycosylase-like protein
MARTSAVREGAAERAAAPENGGREHRRDRTRPPRPWRAAAVLTLALLALPADAVWAGNKLVYVYELPDGTRMVTDHRLNNRHYRLVRLGAVNEGVGRLAAHQNGQFFRADPRAYDDLIRRSSERHNVDFALIKAIMHVESSFNPYARSHKGALGLMQLLPDTARRHGVEDVYDPAQNIEAGVRHLRFLLDRFDHRMYLVIAAYNAGENAVRRHNGIPPYTETQLYVRKVLQLKRVYSRAS